MAPFVRLPLRPLVPGPRLLRRPFGPVPKMGVKIKIFGPFFRGFSQEIDPKVKLPGQGRAGRCKASRAGRVRFDKRSDLSAAFFYWQYLAPSQKGGG